MQYAAANEDNETTQLEQEEGIMVGSQAMLIEDETSKEQNTSPQTLNVNISARKTRWKWTDEMIDSLIMCLSEYKTNKDFEGKDMEADLVRMYEDLRQMMAAMYPPEYFGPVEVMTVNEDLRTEDKIILERVVQGDRKNIKIGYGRIRERVKQIRCNFKKSMVEGTRSGSGKMIIQNWDSLVMVWGGCPSVTKIGGAVVSQTVEEPNEDEQESDSYDSLETDTDASRTGHEQSSEIEEPSAYPKKRQAADQLPKAAKFIDNKRTKLEKPISAHQRDQVMMRVAREELELKKRMLRSSNNLLKAWNRWLIQWHNHFHP